MAELEMIAHGLSVTEDDLQKVLRIPGKLEHFWNERDARGFADLFEPHGDFRFHDGTWIKGRKKIHDFWKEQVFQSLPAALRQDITTREVRFVTDNIAVGDGSLRIHKRGPGKEQLYLELEGTLIAIKVEQEWLISAIRLSQLPAG